MADKIMETYETEIDNCLIVVDRLEVDLYDAYVNHRIFNNEGEEVAHPTERNIGNEDDTKSFITREVERASNLPSRVVNARPFQ